VKRSLKRAAFFGLLSAEMAWRWAYLVRRGRAALVVADRWVEDVALVDGMKPLARGLAGRLFLDLLVFLDRDALDATTAKPQLALEDYRAADAALRREVAARMPASDVDFLSIDAPPDVLAERILARHWRLMAGGQRAA
jgi:hypothetical protein